MRDNMKDAVLLSDARFRTQMLDHSSKSTQHFERMLLYSLAKCHFKSIFKREVKICFERCHACCLFHWLERLFTSMSYFCIHTELISWVVGWQRRTLVQAASTVRLLDCGNCLISPPLLQHYSVAVYRLCSSIFTTINWKIRGFTGHILDVSSVSVMVSPPSMRPGQIDLPILNNIIHAW